MAALGAETDMISLTRFRQKACQLLSDRLWREADLQRHRDCCDQSRDHDVRPTSEAPRSTSSNTTLNWRGPFRPAKLIYRRTAGVRSRHRSDRSVWLVGR